MKVELKDFLKVVIEKLNYWESEMLRSQGHTNECFFNSDGSLTKEYEINVKEKKKYFYIDFGNCGGFMVSKEVVKGFDAESVFGIKGYGTPNFKKWYGVIRKIDIKRLHSLRWDYRR